MKSKLVLTWTFFCLTTNQKLMTKSSFVFCMTAVLTGCYTRDYIPSSVLKCLCDGGDGCSYSLLPQYPNHSLSPDHRSILWNSKQGFTIRAPTFYYIGFFYCQTITEGVTHKSRIYFVHRPGQQCINYFDIQSKSHVNMYVCLSEILSIMSCLSE